MNIRRFEKMEQGNGMIVSYIHAGGKIGVLVAAETDNTGAEVVECLKNVAMQIAAMNPQYLSSDDVSEEYKEKEKAVLLAQAKNDPTNAGKPDNIIEKMIIGRLNKELKEAMTEIGISESGTRSKTAILVKNLPGDVTEDQIKETITHLALAEKYQNFLAEQSVDDSYDSYSISGENYQKIFLIIFLL